MSPVKEITLCGVRSEYLWIYLD